MLKFHILFYSITSFSISFKTPCKCCYFTQTNLHKISWAEKAPPVFCFHNRAAYDDEFQSSRRRLFIPHVADWSVLIVVCMAAACVDEWKKTISRQLHPPHTLSLSTWISYLFLLWRAHFATLEERRRTRHGNMYLKHTNLSKTVNFNQIFLMTGKLLKNRPFRFLGHIKHYFVWLRELL